MRVMTVVKSVLLLLGGMLLIVLCYISPIIKAFPKLTGKHQIGLETLYFIDPKRIKSFSEDSSDKRILVGHVYYPTDNTDNLKRALYLGNKMSVFQKSFTSFFGIPTWLTKLFFRNISTNAYVNAEVSSARTTYPIVLFSHGLLGFPSDMHAVFLEDLASHGYIVIGIDHPYFNIITLYPDGGVVSSDTLTQQFGKMSSSEQKEFQSKAIDIYKADLQFVLDQLSIINQNKNSKFYHHLDLEHICVMGHSAGGTASIEFCRTDNRCKAAINLDGWYDQVIGHEPIKQPLLLVFGSKSLEVAEPTAEYLKRKQLTREQYFEREQKIVEHKQQLCAVSNCSMVILPHVTHGDFGDGILLKWPFRSWNDSDSYKTIAEINKHILKFLDKKLK